MALEKITAHDIKDLISVISTPLLASEYSIIIKDSVDSTNNYLLDLLTGPNKPTHKTVVLSEQQTAGKGRDGRTWVSPPVGNIYMSLYWQFNSTHEKLYALSLTVGIAVARVLKANNLHDVKLKWPNDIFWNNRKMGGILIETKSNSAGVIDVVIGLGLNIQDMELYHDQINQKFVSLESALQHKVYRNKLIAQLLIELDRVLSIFQNAGFDAFVEEWKALSISDLELQSV